MASWIEYVLQEHVPTIDESEELVFDDNSGIIFLISQ